MKIVVNNCFGGFGLSDKALEMLGKAYGCEVKVSDFYDESDRTDKELVKVVEELGADASAYYSELSVVEIDDDATDWHIEDYDGVETVWYVVDGNTYRTY